MSYRIQHGIPIPPSHPDKASYPWRKMRKGDSFLVPCQAKDRRKVFKKVAPAASKAGKARKARFVLRMVKSGVRVWRER